MYRDCALKNWIFEPELSHKPYTNISESGTETVIFFLGEWFPGWFRFRYRFLFRLDAMIAFVFRIILSFFHFYDKYPRPPNPVLTRRWTNLNHKTLNLACTVIIVGIYSIPSYYKTLSAMGSNNISIIIVDRCCSHSSVGTLVVNELSIKKESPAGV